MEKEHLFALLEAFDAYAKESQQIDLQDFAHWILRKTQSQDIDDTQLNRDVGYYLNRVNRYSKLFAKQYLEGLAISSLDEFSFLTVIKILGNPSKSDVYERTITELATGQQMMRRLISLGLIEEKDDMYDKRVKRVRLTEQGLKAQEEAFVKIGDECDFKFAGVDKQSKESLLQILKHLDYLQSKQMDSLSQTN